jgi:uncharacterized protein YjbI with pentapeptide repeats
MDHHSDFWQRPVTDTLAVELVPGDEPSLRINSAGQSLLQLELSEARALIEVLTVAVGELFILKKDPSALTQLQRLLDQDVTLTDGDRERRSASEASRISGQVHGQELIRRYQSGRRNFPKADLRLADLQGADLREINLCEANLGGANLRRANLFQAQLEQADLSQANLEEAGLFRANLRGADLSQATLRRAYLRRANLTDATVTDEQLSWARDLEGATLPDGSTHE